MTLPIKSFDGDVTSRETLLALAYQLNPQALAGRPPANVSDLELAQAILDVMPDASQMVWVGPGKPYTCRGCGVLLGYVIEFRENGKIFKMLQTTGVTWYGEGQPGRCIKCNGKVYFEGSKRRSRGVF